MKPYEAGLEMKKQKKLRSHSGTSATKKMRSNHSANENTDLTQWALQFDLPLHSAHIPP